MVINMFLKDSLIDLLKEYRMFEEDLLIAFLTNVVVFECVTAESRSKIIDDLIKVPPKRKKKFIKREGSVEFTQLLYKNWHKPTQINKEYMVREGCYSLCSQFYNQFIANVSEQEIIEKFDDYFRLDLKNSLYIYFGFARAIDYFNLEEGKKLSYSAIFLERIKENGDYELFQNQMIDLLESQAQIFAHVKGITIYHDMLHNVSVDYLNDLEELTELAFIEKEKEIRKIIKERNAYAEEIRILTEQLNEKDKEIEQLKNEIAILRAKVNTTMKLKGKKVVVIGDLYHSQSYVEIIENYGGECRYFDGSDVIRIEHATRNADLIFYVTAWGGHDIHHMIKRYDNVVYVNNKGLLAFQQAIEKI